MLSNGANISGAESTTLTIASATLADAGVYTCRVKSTIVTDVDIYRKTITLSGVTGIINFKEAGIKVFPIPAKEQLTFVTNGQQITKVEISTMTGYVFKKYTSVSTLDLSDIPAGMYIIELTTKYHIVRDKLLIE